ncbi:MAG: hypothetical protein WKF81_10525 [Thermomicrobiales bacterium]
MHRTPFLGLLAILIAFAIAATVTTSTAQEPDPIITPSEPSAALDLGVATCTISTTPGPYTIIDYNSNPTLTINPLNTKTPPCAATLSPS